MDVSCLHQHRSSELALTVAFGSSVFAGSVETRRILLWELDEFRETYPEFQLEDELFREEGGNVVDAFVGIQYRRRNKGSSAGPSSSG